MLDAVNTRYKICKLNRRMRLTESSVNSNTRESSNGKIEYLCKEEEVGNLLLIELCYWVADRSFFPNKPELISMYWIFVIGEKIFGKEGFIENIDKYMQSIFRAEIY